MIDLLQIAAQEYERSSADALRMLYDPIYSALKNNEYQCVDLLLNAVPVETYPLTLLIGLLTVTRCWRKKLASRSGLYERIAARLQAECPERQDGLLRGLL